MYSLEYYTIEYLLNLYLRQNTIKKLLKKTKVTAGFLGGSSDK